MNTPVCHGLHNPYACVNYNADRFCCSCQGNALRRRLQRNGFPAAPEPGYNAHSIGLTSAVSQSHGLYQPEPYNITPMGQMDVPCGRMPSSSIQYNRLPCKNRRA